jgi:glycyl-tRNA synthetase beta chain
MAELLLELFSEEIPASLQIRAKEDFKKAVADRFLIDGLTYDSIECFATPRRLTLRVEGLPLEQKEIVTEKRGPRIDAPKAAIDGFLKSSGLHDTVENLKNNMTGTGHRQLITRKEDKGEFYFALIKKEGRALYEVLAEILPEILNAFTWPKSMKWGAYNIRWVRPLHNILCVFDDKTVPVNFGHLSSNNKTRGHRFLSSGEFAVKDFADYKKKLLENHVVLELEERKNIIRKSAEEQAKKLGVTIKSDEKLLDEVAGLVEWPVVLVGNIEEKFMHVPQEVLITAMRSHQKYFSMLDSKGNLAPYFVTVSNMQPKDNGAKIISGNERVLRARLEDAKFFWDNDRSVSLESRVAGLNKIIFHAKIGTVLEKVERLEGLTKLLADFIPGLDAKLAVRAAKLCKADLVTQMVGEFPELQGLMGGYYAAESKENPAVSLAIKEHYSPQGPSDVCPTAKVSIAVALADKIDTLIGLFAADEKPTGSKDPYALRRASLGVIRIILENDLRIQLKKLFETAIGNYPTKQKKEQVINDLLEFLADRLRALLKDQSIRHDAITAVLDESKDDDLNRIVQRVKALDNLLKTDDGVNLSAAYKRATNIVLAEEKKDKKSYDGPPREKLLEVSEEIDLYRLFSELKPVSEHMLKNDEFEKVMKELVKLRKPIDDFFEKVTVNSENAAARENRLLLLAQFRESLNKVANFSKIEG